MVNLQLILYWFPGYYSQFVYLITNIKNQSNKLKDAKTPWYKLPDVVP